MWGCTCVSAGTHRVRKRVSDRWNWSYRWWRTTECGCQEPNSGPLQEDQESFNPEPPLQHFFILNFETFSLVSSRLALNLNF